MVIPGKSGRSWSRTSPMLSLTRPEAAVAEPGSLVMRPSLRLVALEEHEPVLADLHLVGVLQDHRVDAVAVDVGAVEAARVRDGEAAALAGERGVPARHGDVVEEDLAVGMATGGDDVLVEQEPAAGPGTPLHDEQRRADGQGVDGGGIHRVELAGGGGVGGGAPREVDGGGGGAGPRP